MHLRFAEFIHNTHNIPFVDKRGKPGSEVLFGQGHVVHLFPMQVIDEIFPYHALAVFQKILLAFAPHSRELFAPLLHFPYFPLIGEAHQADEQIEKQLILFIQVDCFQRLDEVSVCQMGYGLAVRRLHAVLLLQRVCHACLIYFADVETLCTAEYGRQYHFGCFGNQQEDGLLRRLFQQFQQFIGADLVQLFRQPYNGYLVSAFAGFQTEFTGDFIAFLCVDNRLSVFRSHFIQPMIQ